MRRIASTAFVVLSMLFALAACKRTDADDAQATTQAAPPSKPRETTAEYPALKLKAVDGSDYDLAAHKGHWVVVNYWATWCGPCLKEMPDLDALDQRRDDIDVVGLAYDDISVADMRAFLQKHPVHYPILIVDTLHPPADFAVPRGLPTTYLVAPDGKALAPFVGPVTPQELETFIKGAVRE